ncbi:MAG: hypothetical protein GKR94_07495 [Gammaproteobacteria bacterium]|nr:hypothetical protein [Gammaproteobacteria bacterium]
MAHRSYVVLVEKSDVETVRRVRDDIERIGFAVEQSIPEIGTLIGSLDESQIEALRMTSGVTEVSVEDTITLNPPEGDGPF